MRIILIDDEQSSLVLLRRMINGYEFMNIVGEFMRPRIVMEQIPELAPDVVFLDIEMPNMNGIELAKQILTKNRNVQIVFVSAYERYALRAFEVDSVNFILKPICEAVFNVTVKRLVNNHYYFNHEKNDASDEN